MYIAREAVDNPVRHAKPEHVWIRIADGKAGACLSVRDDGVGLPCAALERAGSGMYRMAYRANLIDVRIEFSRPEGGGAQICCELAREANDERGDRTGSGPDTS